MTWLESGFDVALGFWIGFVPGCLLGLFCWRQAIKMLDNAKAEYEEAKEFLDEVARRPR